MKTKLFRIISISMLVILLLVLATVIAGAIAKSNLAKQHPAPGRLVDVGGYRLHINCMGQGSPTVILEAGWGGFSTTWTYIQPGVAKTTRVCSYDRAGYGWSEPSPHPRTANMMAEELHTLLVNAEIKGPYVLVGHSLGGMIVRVYAYHHPDEVIGMVLVDSTHEEQYLRTPEVETSIPATVSQFRMLSLLSSTGFMALAPQSIPNPGMPDDLFALEKAIWATTGYFSTGAAEMAALLDSAAEVRAMRITSFGNLPLSVLSAGLHPPLPSLSDAENQEFWREQLAMQSELVELSVNSVQTIAEQSGHAIQFDQPELVLDAIRQIVEAVR